MNDIKFDIQNETYENDDSYPAIHILIDGRDLIDILKEYELPFATKEGSPNLAGAYACLSAAKYKRSHFLGLRSKTPVLVCECGEEGCWPFIVKITVGENTIVWSDFVQPYRKETWDYSGLGTFVFDRVKYFDELSKIYE